METFTLIVWLWMGQRFEEARVPNLSRQECEIQLFTIDADRREQIAGQCVGASGRVVPDDRLPPAEDWALPDHSPVAPPVVCPIMPPCWQYGRPVRGA